MNLGILLESRIFQISLLRERRQYIINFKPFADRRVGKRLYSVSKKRKSKGSSIS